MPSFRRCWPAGSRRRSGASRPYAVRDVGRRAARHPVIFRAAQEAGDVLMTKERDRVRLLDEQGPPPQEIRAAVYDYFEEDAE